MPLRIGPAALVVLYLTASSVALGLSSDKVPTQRIRTIWTQEQGLPQDTIRALAQTSDGYLWVGTSEGLARFDGYDFVTFSKDNGSLPANAVTALSTGRSGSLWIGTSGGLVQYLNGQFKTFGVAEGLPPGNVNSIVEDKDGVLWVASGGLLSRLERGRFVPVATAPLKSVRVVYEDPQHQLWVAGVEGVVKRTANGFAVAAGTKELDGSIIIALLKDKTDLWMAGNKGIAVLRSDGHLDRFGMQEGLLDERTLSLVVDRDGNLWVGTNGGLMRLDKGHFVRSPLEANDNPERVWCLFEDREGDLWVGSNSALVRLRDGRFSVFGRSEGLPSDQPIAVHQDSQGDFWIGYHDSGLVRFELGKFRAYTTKDGLSDNDIISIRDAPNGDLLIATSGGLSRMHSGRFTNYSLPDPAGRKAVYDALEDRQGRLWAAVSNGVYRLEGGTWRLVVKGDSALMAYSVTLLQTRDGSIWAGTNGGGLWHITNPEDAQPASRSFTAADGLGSNRINSLYQDADGTLWIGTFTGGLTMLRNGVFHNVTARDGLLSDNISHVEDDGKGALWLSTTRGISRVLKSQLEAFIAGSLRLLTPENFGIGDGLRSHQCSPGFPTGSGGARTSDGRLWFPTGLGLATIDPYAATPNVADAAAPIAHITEVSVDGRVIGRDWTAKLKPGTGPIQFRYSGAYLGTPERVRYSYQLEGLDQKWTNAGSRRLADYNRLPAGHYKFVVRAEVPEGGVSETRLGFEVLPHFYETAWFLWACVILAVTGAYGIYHLRLQRIHGRFALVFEERARLAREIHDTLAQGFVGISAQLDALAMKMDGDPAVARQHLTLAQRMARHSLTEARRSVVDLRTSELEEQDLPAALETWARRLVAGSSISVQVEVSNIDRSLPGDLEQNVLRIVQEAVANAVKHARARMILIGLEIEGRFLRVRIRDDGQGFEPLDTFSASGGHFGIVGMRERAERSGGKFCLESHPGSGTQVEVIVPLAR
jgi:ligand-binding sensor domain-containing protein/two-component sensor histidine kinase